MFRILLKWASLKYFIWFIHSKLSKTQKKWKKIFFQKKNWKNFFLYFLNFSFLIGFIQPKSLPKICLMSYYHDHIEKKYVTCISFAYLGIIFKKIAKKNFFCIFKIFHFWSDLYAQNHVHCPTICLMSYIHDYIHKKYVKCTPFAYQGI